MPPPTCCISTRCASCDRPAGPGGPHAARRGLLPLPADARRARPAGLGRRGYFRAQLRSASSAAPRGGSRAAQAGRRSPWRTSSRLTGRSGMVIEHRAATDALDKLQGAAMRAHQLMRHRQPEPGAAAADRTAEGEEQILPRLGRQAGPGVGHEDRAHRARALARDGQAAHQRAFAVGGHCLHGIAAEIGEHAEELLGIGVDLDRRIDEILEFDVGLVERQHALHLLDQLAQPDAARAPAPAPGCGHRRAHPRNRPRRGRARAAASARRPGRSGPSPAAAGRKSAGRRRGCCACRDLSWRRRGRDRQSASARRGCVGAASACRRSSRSATPSSSARWLTRMTLFGSLGAAAKASMELRKLRTGRIISPWMAANTRPAVIAEMTSDSIAMLRA